MKCPTCGAPNKSSNKACYRCGCVLNDRSVQPKGTANSLWYNAAEKKAKPSPPPFWGDTPGKPTYEDKSDFIVLHDEESESNIAQDVVDRGAPPPDNRRKLGRMDDRREVQVVVPFRQAPREKPMARNGRRYRIRWPRLIVAAVLILAVSTGVGYGVFLLYRSAVGFTSQLIADKRGSGAAKAPDVKVATIDGARWHKIIFYGNDGDVVMLKNPKRNVEIKDGQAVVDLEDQSFITPGLTTDKVTVSLEADIISPDGKSTHILVQPYAIDVPLAPLKIILPAEQNTTTDCDSVLVKIKVAPGSRRVMIGSYNVTDSISADGIVSHTVDQLAANQVNTIIISVDTANYRKNVYELKVIRPLMEVPIELSRAPSSADGKTVKIEGSTEPGATITTNAAKSVTINKTTGIFSFTATLKAWGWNDIQITATSASGRTSTMTHRVNHAPVESSYSRSAQVLDYNYLLSAYKLIVGRVYAFNGTVVRKIENENSNYYLVHTGDAANLKPVVLELKYSSEAKLEPDKSYKVFADVVGVTVENYPVLEVWYKPLPSPASSSSSGASSSPGASVSPSVSPESTH